MSQDDCLRRLLGGAAISIDASNVGLLQLLARKGFLVQANGAGPVWLSEKGQIRLPLVAMMGIDLPSALQFEADDLHSPRINVSGDYFAGDKVEGDKIETQVNVSDGATYVHNQHVHSQQSERVDTNRKTNRGGQQRYDPDDDRKIAEMVARCEGDRYETRRRFAELGRELSKVEIDKACERHRKRPKNRRNGSPE